jgi:hypothetical protein
VFTGPHLVHDLVCCPVVLSPFAGSLNPIQLRQEKLI